MPITTPPTPGRRRRNRSVIWAYITRAVILTALAVGLFGDPFSMPPAAQAILFGSLIIVTVPLAIASVAELVDGDR